MKILVPVDGSPFTKRMLAYLAAHDEWLGGTHDYTLLHAVPPVPARAAAVLDRDILKGYYDDSAERVFKPIRAFLAKHPELKVKYTTKTGVASDVIAESAKKGDFDLVVMGSHGHGSLSNLVMGSVATKVIAQCKVPVLLVR
jgi:nucleotide-binding universal stress UspA family protein